MDLGFIENKAYRNALEFLIRNEPEQRLDVRLSFKCFRALEYEAHKLYGEEASYPCVEYSSKDTTVTIITAQSGLHAKAAEALQRGREDRLRRELTNRGRGDLIERFGGVFDVRLNALDDQLRLYVKKPDEGLTYYKDGVETVIAVFEIGVSESYLRLKADIELWMAGSNAALEFYFRLRKSQSSAIQPNQPCIRILRMILSHLAMRSHRRDSISHLDRIATWA
ncbi:hypothetical protein V1517DRAFT_337513 [Lipomyces orientalis]|uniref:Uncharacterized protein n=1 Tax=Lipomyces orientalis TaxID=1233043 RepID=A0ACC3TSF0_9ASCO